MVGRDAVMEWFHSCEPNAFQAFGGRQDEVDGVTAVVVGWDLTIVWVEVVDCIMQVTILA